jgi:hypothetical protein
MYMRQLQNSELVAVHCCTSDVNAGIAQNPAVEKHYLNSRFGTTGMATFCPGTDIQSFN